MHIKDMPSYNTLMEIANRYPSMDIQVCEAWMHAVRTGTILHHCVERGLSKLGLSFSRFLILCLLNNDPESIPVCKLAEMASVTTPTVSAVLSGMVRDGLVERLGDSSDKRMVRMGLKPEGRKILDNVLPGIFQNQAVVMQGLNSQELKTLVALLSKIRLDDWCGAEDPGLLR
jgi:DNA-binding MarR family transcriptional regulator